MKQYFVLPASSLTLPPAQSPPVNVPGVAGAAHPVPPAFQTERPPVTTSVSVCGPGARWLNCCAVPHARSDVRVLSVLSTAASIVSCPVSLGLEAFVLLTTIIAGFRVLVIVQVLLSPGCSVIVPLAAQSPLITVS